LLLCGVALVILRLFPTGEQGWISKLFFDDIIHARIEALTVKVISFLGLSSSAYQAFASNLASLGHAFAIILQVLAISLIFYIIARRI
jgi:hypothetical protein